MVTSKKKIVSHIIDVLMLGYLAIFPLGQLLRVNLAARGNTITFQPIDAVALTFTLLTLCTKKKFTFLWTRTRPLFSVLIFSYILSLVLHGTQDNLASFLYLIRLFCYVGFAVFLYFYSKNQVNLKRKLFNSLILIGLMVAIGGWIQYIFVPNLVFLKQLGWDDHLYRLAGSFLDPGFTGIILVLGFLLTLKRYIKGKHVAVLVGLVLFLVSIAFTYSRASYLALLAGLLTIAISEVKKKALLVLFFSFVAIVVILPRPASEGVLLERTASISAKIDNYKETWQILKRYPVFGVGYNKLCAVRIEMFGGKKSSHACSGSDSSLLVILATTGVIGAMTFINTGVEIAKRVSRNFYGQTFFICLASLLVHSLFVNSLFYPWVMGWMGILLALSL
jgi:hypothetical protein